jgi:hypothetical protein
MSDDWLIIVPVDPFASPADEAVLAAVRTLRDGLPDAWWSGDTTLNDLSYDWPQAFARVSIEAMNPNVTDLEPHLKDAVAAELGTPVRMIWQHI